MREIKNKVIVWGVDGFNTLGLMRELGNHGLDLVFLIKGHKGIAASSKYCKKYIETATVEDGYEFLLKNYTSEEDKPIIITPGDDIIIFIDRHKEELEKHFIIPGASIKGDSERYTDKNNMTALAEEIGILCPKSRAITKESDISGIEYPCLIKPSHEKPGHYNEFKFKICKSEKKLKKTLRYVRPDSEFIIQQYIPKELDLLVYGGRMWDGNTVIAGAFIRDRLSDSGSSSHGYFTNQMPSGVDVSKICDFLDRIDYHGLFSFEYGLLDDKAYFFEVNLRNDGTSHYFYQCGANIPLAYVYSSSGLDYSHIITGVAENRWFIDELYDVENVLSGKVSRKKWKQEMTEATVFKYYDKEDIAPYQLEKQGSLKQIVKDILLKRFRLYIVFVLDKMGLRK